MSKRIRILGLAMLVCFVALFVQLNNLQVIKAHQYATDPNNPQVIAQVYDQPRGIIESADGQVLAQSVAGPAGSRYKWVRQYPEQWATLFSHIVGIFSYDYAPKGGYGVEGTYDKYLVAHNAPIKNLSDLLTTRTVTDTVTLTISTKLQQAAASALAGHDGAVVALDPTTGAILAMYSNPTYDPNPLASTNIPGEVAAFKADVTNDANGNAPLASLAYQRAYPPGSTFKTITTAAAYDHAPQFLSKSYPVLSCTKLPQTDKQLCNFHGGTCGGTVPQMLPPSCDTGYALLGLDVGGTNLYDEATGFGFDSLPPLDLPVSAVNALSAFPTPVQLAQNLPGVAYSAIGQQNVQANALQMAMVAAGFADGGVVMTPHVMSSIHDSQGNLVTQYKPTAWRQATSQATAAAVLQLMTQVTHAANGTAAGIFPPGEDVAAKTGTAQTNNGASTTDWMIAFAPASGPKVAIAVVVPGEPGGVSDTTGAAVAGPIVRAMIAAALGQ